MKTATLAIFGFAWKTPKRPPICPQWQTALPPMPGISVIHIPPAYEPPDGGVCKRLRVSAVTSFGSPDETHAAKCAKSENETRTLAAGVSAGGNWFSGTGSVGVSFSPSPR